ncbi:MAG: type III pantothenate kinase [Alistipes sp.]|nr:type III pantothenate kinase [Alistipes sp.]
MKLIVDIGNSRAKVVVMRDSEVVKELVCEQLTADTLRDIVARWTIRRAIVASTRGDATEVVHELREMVPYVVEFSPARTPMPIENRYHSPETLGADRIAAAVGVEALYPGCDAMIVDFGTAITVDFVVDGAYLGGNISPGVTTRFRALADYTARLPLCSATEEVLDLGRTTREAIEQGVMRGVEYEIRGYIEDFLTEKAKKIVIFTGGDAKYFAKRIKNAIFADCEPVIYGLSRILEYNAEQS